jgi:hypothetical protein
LQPAMLNRPHSTLVMTVHDPTLNI